MSSAREPSPTRPALAAMGRAGFYGLLFGVVFLLVDGLHHAFAPAVATWALPLHIGAGAPIALACALLAALAFPPWGRLKAVRSVEESGGLVAWLRGRLWDDAGEALVARTAWLLTVLMGAGVWLAAGVAVGIRIEEEIETAHYRPALLLGGQVVVLLLLGLLAPGAAALLEVLLGAFARLGRAGALLVRPAVVAAALTVAAAAAAAAAWIRFHDVLEHIAWAYVTGPLTGLAAVAAARWLLRRRPGAFRPAALSLLGGTLALGLFTLLLPARLQAARTLFLAPHSAVSPWIAFVDRVMDFDGDGSTNLYGGGDCAPFDPTIGPHALEILGDGIDQDCAFGDLELDPGSFSAGRKQHPRPTGLSRRPNVILITSDALSFHHTNLSDYERTVTPNLAAWGKRATVFEAAFATSTSTRLSMPGLVAGMYNVMMPLYGKRHPFHYGRDVVTIASMLKKLGYRTKHVIGNSYFGKSRWGGYWNGIDRVDEAWKRAKDKVHAAPEVTESALEILKEDSKRPLFLWLHYYDHHGPYETPAGVPSFGEERVDRYDAEVLHTDRHWAKVIAAVEKKWSPEDYILIFTSDHGEAFNKYHTKKHHDFTLDTEVLHVPLVIQTPWQRGLRVPGLVSHLDILPTLANLLGVPPEEQWMGESLVPVLAHGAKPEKTAVYSLFYVPRDKKGSDGYRWLGVRTNDLYYFIDYQTNEHRLVRWREDRLDENNLYHRLPQEAAIYRQVVGLKRRWLEENEKGWLGTKESASKATKARAKPKKAAAPKSPRRAVTPRKAE